MASIARLRAAHVPWLHHLVALALGLFLHSVPQVRLFLLCHVVVAFFVDTEHLLRALQDPSEPPLIPHPYLPFLGHIIAMFWYGAKYYDDVNRDTQHPIYALQTLNSRTIIVTSPQLAAPIQRASKSTSFYGIIIEVTKRLLGFDEPTMEILRHNLDDQLGNHEGVMHESNHMIASVLSPGPILNQLCTTQLDQFSDLLNDTAADGPLETNLMDFVKRLFAIANAYTIYGPRNPFALHPELMQKFWDYEAGMIPVMADIFPSLTARKPWLAREAINKALQEFLEEEHYRAASPMIQRRVAINMQHGLTTKMAGRAELILIFAILGNAVPTTFWLLAYIYGNPELLERIRAETSPAVSVSATGEKAINVTMLKTACPLLVSTYRETQRLIGNLASVRLVTNTHTVTAPGYATYVLKKGSMIQIAAGVIHTAESTWGFDAKAFNPDRFISTTTSAEQFSSETNTGVAAEQTATQLPKNVPSAAYRVFGGGSVICPGRHFAQSEILGFLAMVVHMFDITKPNGDLLAVPEREQSKIPLAVMKPVVEPRVLIKRRAGEEGVVWRLEL